MKKLLEKFLLLPIWLKVSISVTEILFVLILGAVIAFEYQSLKQNEQEVAGAKDAQRLIFLLVALTDSQGQCALAATVNVGAPDAEEKCKQRRQHYDQMLEKSKVDWYTSAALKNLRPDSTQIHSRNASHELIDDQEQLLLDALFSLYRDSGMQLNADRASYTTGRTLLIQLPELYAYLGIARYEALFAYHGVIDLAHLQEKQGAVHLIARQTQNTLESLLQSDNSMGAQALADTLERLHKKITAYFSRTIAQRIADASGAADIAELQAYQVASDLLSEVMVLSEDVAKRFYAYSDIHREELVKQLELSVFIAILLQILLLLLYVGIAKSVYRAERSALELAGTLKKQDKMFAIIGHELRTPAATLKMQVDELQLKEPRDPAVKELVSTSEHLLDVLDDMRVGSDSSMTNEHKTKAKLSVHKLCDEALRSLDYLADRFKVSLSFNSSVESEIECYGFKKQIRQIVINLVKNAIIHAEATQIELRLQSHAWETGNTYFKIEVIDNGKGISEELRPRLFEAYERGETVSTGTGLGLHVSRELALGMQEGSLEYHPNEGKGSIFTLSFVLQDYQEQQSTIDGRSLIEGKRILLVEDTPTLLMLAHAILQRAGAEVTNASDGVEALARIENQEFDLILTDIMMPEMDGYELTQKLRAMGIAIPIIGVTGATVGDEAERLLQCGADRVLPKPLTIANLTEALK